MKRNINKKLILKSATIGVVLILLLLTIYLFVMPRKSVNYNYEIEIIPSGDGSYNLFVPVPITEDDSISQIFGELRIISGNASFSTTHSTHGYAINITANGPVILRISGNDPEKAPIDAQQKQGIYLSMATDNFTMGKKGHFWVWCNAPDNIQQIEIHIDFSLVYISDSIVGTIASSYKEYGNGVVDNGWNLIEGYKEGVAAG